MEQWSMQSVIKKKLESKHQDMNLGTSAIQYIAGDQVNKIDSQKHRGLDNSRNEKLYNFLYRSDFLREREVAGKYNSLYGEVNIALLFIDGEYYNTFLQKAENCKVFKRDYIEFTGKSLIGEQTASISRNGKNVEVDIYWNFKIEEVEVKGKLEKRVVRRNMYIGDNDKFLELPETQKFIYPKEVNKIPVRVLPNNAEGDSDWSMVSAIFKTMDTLSNDLPKEWERTKTLFNLNSLFSNGTSPADIAKAIDNGDFMLGGSGHSNSKLGADIQPIISGSVSIQNLIFALQYLEDKALKYSFQGRDLDGSGTNKHGLQVGLYGQSASEYISRKKKTREDAYTSYFKDIVSPFVGIVLSDSFKVTIDDSLFEQGKVAGMLAEQERSKLMNNQGRQLRASEKKLEKDADKVVAETDNIKTKGFNNQSITAKADGENENV